MSRTRSARAVRAWAGVFFAVVPTVTCLAAAPPEGRAPSFPIEAGAKTFVGRFTREELAKDEVFLGALKELAKSDLSPRAKADAFALLRERIGWLFTGALRLFPGCGYAQSQSMVFSTYFQYQLKMPAGLEVGPLLDLAKADRGDHPLRSPNALLLAVILNRGAATAAVEKAIDPKAIAAAEVPAIDLHDLATASALTGDPKVVAKLVALLPETGSEESREDLISATVNYQNDGLRNAVEAFVRKSFPGLFDNSVRTALIALVHVSPPDHFRDFYKSLGELARGEEDVDLLRKFWDSRFRDRLQSDDPAKQSLKIWDGFTFKAEGGDGVWIAFGDTFRYWVSFK